jgi:hypothetical protein
MGHHNTSPLNVRGFRNKYIETILTLNPYMSDNFRNILKTGSNLSTLMSTDQVLNGGQKWVHVWLALSLRFIQKESFQTKEEANFWIQY